MEKETEQIEGEYTCVKCKEEWNYEHYDYEEGGHPKVCPFCTMPKTQLFKDVYKEEGLFIALKEVLRRL